MTDTRKAWKISGLILIICALLGLCYLIYSIPPPKVQEPAMQQTNVKTSKTANNQSGHNSQANMENGQPTAPKSDEIPTISSTSLAAVPKMVGLQNLGNTCFFNSFAQVMYHCRPFRKNLEKVINNPELLRKNPRAKAYFDLFKSMDLANRPLGQGEIKLKELLRPEFIDGQFHKLLDIYNDLKTFNKDMWSPFTFQRKEIKRLVMQNGVVVTEEPNFTPVSVCSAKISFGFKDTMEALKMDLNTGALGMPHRPEVKSATWAKTIGTLPEAIIVNINRLDADERSRVSRKVEAITDLYVDELMDGYDPNQAPEHLYRLRSFVLNIGNYHFKAFARDENNVWYELNDSVVTRLGDYSKIKQLADTGDFYIYERV